METTYHLNFKIERADYIAVNTLMLEINPEWKLAAAKVRRKELLSAWALAPIIIVVCSLLLGMAHPTRGMYLEGAVGGALFAGILIYGISQIDPFDKIRSRHIQRLRGSDFSSFCGDVTLRADGRWLFYAGPSGELKLPWHLLAARDTPHYVLVVTAFGSPLFVPKSAFPSPEAARTFYADAVRWHTISSPSPAQRVALYLADRDLPCPKCKYNLRGTESNACPECGLELTVEKLSAIPQ